MSRYPLELRCDCVGVCNTIKFFTDDLDEGLIWVEHYVGTQGRDGIVSEILHRIKAAWMILIGREYLLQETTIWPEQMATFVDAMKKRLEPTND